MRQSQSLGEGNNSNNLLKDFPFTNLPSKVFEGIFDSEVFDVRGKKVTRLEYLFEKGYIHTKNQDKLLCYIKEKFKAYYDFENTGTYLLDSIPDNAKSIFEDVTKLLVISGVARLITAGDWSVNRLAMAERRHGLQENGFSKFEQVLARKYSNGGEKGKPAHLHKGPGNGVLPHHLLKGQHDDNTLKRWHEIGIGDQLYFPLEKILDLFVKEEYKDNPNVRGLVEVLSAILKKMLKRRWFNQNSSSINRWKMVTPFSDLNDIYLELRKLLETPEKYLGRVFDAEKGKIKSSVHFEDDSSTLIGLELYGLLLKILGKDINDIEKKLKIKAKNFYNIRLKTLSGNISELKGFRKILSNAINAGKKGLEPILKSDIIRKISNIGNITIEPNIKDIDLLNLIKELIKTFTKENAEVKEILDKIKGSNTDEELSLRDIIPGFGDSVGLYNGETIKDFFQSFFTDDFSKSVLEDNGEKPDLNKSADMYFNNFWQGYFTESNKLFKRKFLLITATRSDSHETDEKFKEDINKNLDLLEPGGCLLTDGFKESFSCIYRFDALIQILRERGSEFKAEVIVNSNNNSPLSVLIQRKHPEGYLTDDEKKEIFGANIIFDSLQEVASRPYIFLVNRLRRKLLNLTSDGHDIDIFKKLQGSIKVEIERILSEYGLKKSKNEHFDYIKDLFFTIKGIIDTSPELKSFIANFFSNVGDVDIGKLDELNGKYPEGTIEKLKEALVFPEIRYLLGLSRNKIGDDDILKAIYFRGDGDIRGYIRQQIRLNSKTDFLEKTDIKEMLDILEKRLEGEVHNCSQETRVRVLGTLKVLQPGKVYVFPSKGEITPYNRRGFYLDGHTMPNNQDFLSVRSMVLLDEKKRNFVEKVKLLSKRMGMKPICIISYTDCVTNNILLEKLKKIFGDEFCEKYVRVVGIGYREKGGDKDLIRHFSLIKRDLSLYEERGGIIIGGGSWTNADDEYSKAYKTAFGYDLLDAVERGDSNLRVLNICLSEQIWADMIGKRYFNGDIRTNTGMLEIGPTSVSVIKEHEIFKGCPGHFTVAMTHSGHVCDTRVSGYKDNSRISFLAKSDVTGLPIAYSAFKTAKGVDKVIGLQWHPEVDLLDNSDIDRIMKELSGFKKVLVDQYGIPLDAVRKNFSEINNPDGTSYLKANSGDFILVSSLEYLARGISI